MNRSTVNKNRLYCWPMLLGIVAVWLVPVFSPEGMTIFPIPFPRGLLVANMTFGAFQSTYSPIGWFSLLFVSTWGIFWRPKSRRVILLITAICAAQITAEILGGIATMKVYNRDISKLSTIQWLDMIPILYFVLVAVSCNRTAAKASSQPIPRSRIYSKYLGASFALTVFALIGAIQYSLGGLLTSVGWPLAFWSSDQVILDVFILDVVLWAFVGASAPLIFSRLLKSAAQRRIREL